MKSQPKVALLIEMSNAYARGLLRGIVQFVREQQPPWSVQLVEQGRGAAPPAWLSTWKGHGIIARIENHRIAKAVTMTGLPAVDVSAARTVPNIPWVETDDHEIARLAFEHFHERGFRNYGYCGDSQFNWSSWRRDHFVQVLKQFGIVPGLHDVGLAPAGESGDRRQRRLGNWLKALPKPTGVLVCYDILARELLDVCRVVGIAVPEEVAIMGVDNDDLLCNLSSPPLTSVQLDTHQTGYRAASLLADLMEGRSVTKEAHLVKPLGIATRQSTDILAIQDSDVAAAVRFIRENACSGINVADVLKQVPCTRRVLEQRFSNTLGRSPHDEIIRVKIDRVKQLLLETDLPMSVVAERSGFRHVEYLSVAFKRETGQSPARFRNERG